MINVTLIAFEKQYDHELSTTRAVYLTEQTGYVSSVIASKPNVDVAMVSKFVSAWRRSGFLV